MSKTNKRWQKFLIGSVFSKTSTETPESSHKALHSAQLFFEIHCTATYHTKVRLNPTQIFICLIYFVTFTGTPLWKLNQNYRKNILKFGYGIIYKYEGTLAHLFDRFYVVTQFVLPTMDDLKLSLINYDKECKYLENLDDNDNEEIKICINDLITYCIKLRPYMAFYKMQI